MINEKKLIEKLNKNSIFKTITNAEGKNIYEIIDELPKVGQWISVKDRLPDKPIVGEDNYIVQIKHVIEPCSAYWNGEYWTDLYNDVLKDVIAWMPLPDPYKGDE